MTMTLGVGDGSGQLFVNGDYDSIKTAQEKLMQREKLIIALQAIAKDHVAMGRDAQGDIYFDNSKTVAIVDFARDELHRILG
jgi:hypothetical protein